MDMRGYSLDESPEAPLLRAEPEQSLRCAHCSDNVGSVSSARTLHAETFPRGPQPDIRVDPIIVVGRFIVFVTSLAGIIVQSVDIPQDPRVAGLFALTLITLIYSIGTLGVHILLGHLSATTRHPRFPELSFTCGLSWYTGGNDRGITRGRKRQFQCPLLGLTDLALAIPLLIFTILVADKMSRDRYYHNERRLVAITTLGSISTAFLFVTAIFPRFIKLSVTAEFGFGFDTDERAEPYRFSSRNEGAKVLRSAIFIS